MWHVETDYAAVTIFLILLLKYQWYRKEDARKRAFYIILLIGLFCSVLDLISSEAMNHPVSWWLYELSMTLYVTFLPLMNASWVSYMVVMIYGEDKKKVTRTMAYVTAPCMVYYAVALTNPWNGWFFTLTKDMQYARGPLFLPVGIGFLMAYSIFGLILVICNRRLLKNTFSLNFLYAAFISSLIVPLLQLFYPGTLLTPIAYAVLFVLFDATVEEENRQQYIAQINAVNEELQKAVIEAASASRAKTEFLSLISHDIRTPLNGIIGLTYLCEKMDLPKEAENNLKEIDTSSKFLLSLINDVLDLSKAESGKFELHPEPYQTSIFNDYIKAVIEPLCADKNQKLIVDVDALADSVPLIDIMRFNQILFNLLSNAVKYTPEGGTITCSIHESINEKGRCVEDIVVKDNGIGMSEEFQKKLFEPFTQEERLVDAEQKGTGLGLSIVQKLVDLMHGTVEVKSKIGSGTVFHVVMDFACVSLASIKEQENIQVKDAAEVLAGKHILLCEDHPINQKVAVSLLESKKAIVTVADDGSKGVQLFQKSPANYYDLILMDIRMPVMDGLEATKIIRRLDRTDAETVPIVAMTANAYAEDVNECLKAGMNGHIAKPIEPENMFRIIARQIEADQK